MPSGTRKFCQACAQSGRQSRLKLYQINFSEAIQLCEDKSCSFPLEASSGSSSIQKRDLASVPPLKRKSSSSRSVKSAFSTPFGTPTVLSPVSFTPFKPTKTPKPTTFNGDLPFVNSIFSSDNAVENGIVHPVNRNCEELDLEGLLNSGVFDEPFKPCKTESVVNGFKEPLPLKTQNPPNTCSEFSKKYVTKSPRSLLRNPFDDILLDIDENTNVFPFDSEFTDFSTAVNFTNGLDFHQLTNDFNSHEEKHLHRFEKHLSNFTYDKFNNSLCTQHSESALDAEVRSIFESSHQLFEKNNLWSSLSKDKMMSPIKDTETGLTVEDETSGQGTDQVDGVQEGQCELTGQPSVEVEHQMSCSTVTENITLESINQHETGVDNITENESVISTNVTEHDETPVNNSEGVELVSDIHCTELTTFPPAEVAVYQTEDVSTSQGDGSSTTDHGGPEEMIIEQSQVTSVELAPTQLAAEEESPAANNTPEELTTEAPDAEMTEVSVPHIIQQTADFTHGEVTSLGNDCQTLEEVTVQEENNTGLVQQDKNIEDNDTVGLPSIEETQIAQSCGQTSEAMDLGHAQEVMCDGQETGTERSEDIVSNTTGAEETQPLLDVLGSEQITESESADDCTMHEEVVGAGVEAVSIDESIEGAPVSRTGSTVLTDIDQAATVEDVELNTESEELVHNTELAENVQTEPSANLVETVLETRPACPDQNECEFKNDDSEGSGISCVAVGDGPDLPGEEVENEVQQLGQPESTSMTDETSGVQENVQTIHPETPISSTDYTEVLHEPVNEDTASYSVVHDDESVVTTTEMVVHTDEADSSHTEPEVQYESVMNTEQIVNIETNVHLQDNADIVETEVMTAIGSSEINANQTAILPSDTEIPLSTNLANIPCNREAESVTDSSTLVKEDSHMYSGSVVGAVSDIQQQQTDMTFITASHQNLITCPAPSDTMQQTALEYSAESEITKSVDDAQPFQTIENVPILEQEVQGVSETFETVTVSGQEHQFENVLDENMVIQQTDDIASAGLVQEQINVSVNGMNVVGQTIETEEGVVVSLPEQNILAGDLNSQIFTVPINSAELQNVTQTMHFTGVDQIVTQQSNFISEEDALPDIPQVGETSHIITQVSGAEISPIVTTQGVLLQTGLGDNGTIYTLPQTTLPTMAVTTESGIFTVASSASTGLVTNYLPQSGSLQTADSHAVHQAPILISDSSVSLPDNTVTTPVGQTAVSETIPPETTQEPKLNIIRDAFNMTTASTEQSTQIVSMESDDSGPVQVLDKKCLNLFVQWQNRDAMCWLDVVMIVLCNSPTIQKLFTDDLNTEALDNTVLSTLLKAYYQAQTLMQRLTNKVHTDYKENLAKNAAAANEADVPKTESSLVEGVSGSDQNEGSTVSIEKPSDRTTEKADQPAKPKTTTVVNKISIKSMQDYFKAVEILDAVREKIWSVLQPRLQCERGKNDSPLFALPLLVREPSLLKEKFKIKFKYSFTCDQCLYHQEDDHSKILPSFPEVPSDFNMIEPCFVRNCFQCKNPGKRMKMTFSSIPDMLLLHFKEGLPHCRLNELCFTFGGETYTVTAVIQYKNNPDHFVAWIRNGTGDQWMECDDLKSTLCQFTTQEPAIPPNQIHIIMWEKNVPADAARDLEETSACNILQSCLRVLQPDVLPGTSVVLPGKEALAQSLKRKAETASTQNTVKYILSQAQGGKVPGVITLPPGTNMGGLQAVKIINLPPASSASGLLANVAGLSSVTSAAGQVVSSGQLLQGATSSFKPVILQSKTRTPSILSSPLLSSSTTSQICQQVTPVKTTAGVSQVPAATTMRVVKSGNKIMYVPVEKIATDTTPTSHTVLSGSVVTDSSGIIGNQQVTVQSSQTGVAKLGTSLVGAGMSKVPNLKYIQLDKAQFQEVSGNTDQAATPLPAQLVDGSSKTYVVGSDGILQEVSKQTTPVKKPTETASASTSVPNLSGHTPKIIVRRKTESGEIVQSVVTNLDFKENNDLIRAIESLKNGDADTGGALIQQLIKGKVISTGQTAITSPSTHIQSSGQPVTSPIPTQDSVLKVINVKSDSPVVQQTGTPVAQASSHGAKYVKVGDNIIQIHSAGTPPVVPSVGRGRGRGRGQSRGGRKKKPLPIMTNPTSVQKPIDLTSIQTSPVKSEPQRILISPQGQVNQTGVSVTANPVSHSGMAVSKVVKILSSPSGSTTQSGVVGSGPSVILGQPTVQTLTNTPHGLSSVQGHQTLSPGKKVTTILASHLAQGGILQKNPITTAQTSVKAVSVKSSDKSSPVKFILPSTPGLPLSPTRSPTSIIMKVPQSAPVARTGTTLTQALPSHNISISSLSSEAPISLTNTSPVQGITVQTHKGKVVAPAQTLQTVSPQTPSSASLQSVASLISANPVQSASSVQKGKVFPGKTLGSTVPQSPVHTLETGVSPVHSPGPPDVEVLSDSDGSKSPTKSPKYNPVISVKAAHGDAALLAKAIQTLVDKGVPIQQIQNQAFLSKLIATLKPKGSLHASSSPATVAQDGGNTKSLIQSSLPKPSVSGVRSPPQIVVSKSVDVSDTPTSNTQNEEKGLQEVSGVSVSTPVDEESSTKSDSYTGKTHVVIKPGQSYLAAVKPFLKLGPTEGKVGSQAVFDGYKLKSEIIQSKTSSEGFATIDMIKGQEKGGKKHAGKSSAPVAAPVPVVATKTDSAVTVEEPIQELTLQQGNTALSTTESSTGTETILTKQVITSRVPVKTPGFTALHRDLIEKISPKISSSKTPKVASDIMVVESTASVGRGKKANPLHVIADAAVSRLPVEESMEDVLPAVTPPSGKGKGRSRGRPPKKTKSPRQSKTEFFPEISDSSLQMSSAKEDVKPQINIERHKRSFMDAFKSPQEVEILNKERKVECETNTELNVEKTSDAALQSNSEVNTLPFISDKTESFVKPKGRLRKQTLTASASLTDVATPKSPVGGNIMEEQSDSSEPSRGKQRKQSADVDPVSKTNETIKTKEKGQQPSSTVSGKGTPEPKGKGRPRKLSLEETKEQTPTTEPKGPGRPRKQLSESPADSDTRRRELADSKLEVAETPRGRGRPPKVSSSLTGESKPRGRPPKQSPSEDTAKKTPKADGHKVSKAESFPAKETTPKLKTNTSEILVVSEVQYIGKYKILPIERPNTRRGGQRVSSPGGARSDVASPKSPAQANEAKSAKRRGRPPANPAKRAKTE